VVFAGRLDKSHLGVVERIAVKCVGAPVGDFRDWDSIEHWAAGIAHEIGVAVPQK
jgi:menaquinone-dependent protoporphyrinogen oxidase